MHDIIRFPLFFLPVTLMAWITLGLARCYPGRSCVQNRQERGDSNLKFAGRNHARDCGVAEGDHQVPGNAAVHEPRSVGKRSIQQWLQQRPIWGLLRMDRGSFQQPGQRLGFSTKQIWICLIDVMLIGPRVSEFFCRSTGQPSKGYVP